MTTDEQLVEAARRATASLLGYRSWGDANDYRLTGKQDRQVELTYRAFHAFGLEVLTAATPSDTSVVFYDPEDASYGTVPPEGWRARTLTATASELADELRAAIEAWHSCAPQGQGEDWSGDADEKRNAMCQLFYDNSERIIEALKQHAPEALLRDLRHRADMISIVEQGCGGTLTFKEMANSAMSQARDMVRLIDAHLAALKGERP